MNGRDNQEWAIHGHRQHLAYNTVREANKTPKTQHNFFLMCNTDLIKNQV